MTDPQKRFCVLTTGRAGSTSLVKVLAKFPDVAMPSKNIDCFDEELLHRDRLRKHMGEYARLCGTEITTRAQLIDCFFRYNAGFPFCGFKSMPERHPDYRTFIHTPGIKFVILSRKDIASTVASFIAAMKFGSWRRDGSPPKEKWLFQPENDGRLVLSNLAYIHESLLQLDLVPNAIRISYEEFCDPAFENPELDEYFERPIRPEDPKPPTSGQAHVANWGSLESFVARAYETLKNGRPMPRR